MPISMGVGGSRPSRNKSYGGLDFGMGMGSGMVGPGVVNNTGGVMPPGGGGGLSNTAQTYPALEALQGRMNKYLDNLEGNTGHVMDVMGTKFRDAREGGRESLRQANAFSGRSSTPATANYESQTQRGVQGTLADVANERERMLGGALQGSLGIMRAPADLALQEKGLGIQQYQAQTAAENAAAQMNLQALLAMLQAQRQSPIYT